MKINKKRLYEIIFEADTTAGKVFDLSLISMILISILTVMLDSIPSVHDKFSLPLRIAEWVITLIFTIEYILRIYVVNKPVSYIFSFYGIVDLMAILPGFIVFIFPGVQSLMVIRAVRLLRVFRILKFSRYTSAGRSLMRALYRSREKILIFISVVITLVVIFGTIIYLIEGEENGFTSIPVSIYWAVVTLTTVGYGDIAPVTGLGQFLASVVMIMGYAIIAVPTGIVTTEMIKASGRSNTQVCQNCMFDRHEDDALYCKKCGTKLDLQTDQATSF
ncbi:MAG TPA: ion transporter [Bacteroidales bacterium]|nr:ion transporter [Bacteroidales bacterium]